MADWWNEPFRIFQTNLREIDATLDVDKVLDDLEECHATVWLLNTGGIVSFFPSKLPYQHPSPWLKERPSGDLVGDAVEAAHQRGIRILSRVDFSKCHEDVFQQHPDWFYRNEHGEYQVFNGLYSTCPSGPYNQELSFEILAEIMDSYDIDGFFFNMFGYAPWDYGGKYWGICQCENCQRRFRANFSRALPKKIDWEDPAYLDYQQFKTQTSRELSGRIRRFIHRKKAGVGLVLFMHAGDGDVIMHEVNNGISRPLPYWIWETGERCKTSAGYRPGAPVTINSVLFLDIPYRFNADQPGKIGLRLAQMFAHGANPYIYVIGTPDQPDSRNLPICRQMYEFHAGREHDYRDLGSPARVALVLPDRSQLYYGRGDAGSRVTASYRGMYRALLEHHIQFDILHETNLAEKSRDGQLNRYEVLVLPNTACLSDEDARCIDKYVEEGGGLLATGTTGLYTGGGEPRSRFSLRSLGLGSASPRPDRMKAAYFRIRPEDRGLLAGLEETELIPLDGLYVDVEAEGDVQTYLTLIPPTSYGPPEKCYWEQESEAPGVLLHAWGEGRTAYIPWQPGKLFHELCLPEYALLIARLTDSVRRGQRMLETNAPPFVEAVVRDQPHTGKRFVHLVNYSGHNGRSFHGPCELVDLWVRVESATNPSRVVSAKLERDLDFESKDGGVTFQLPSLWLFDQIALVP